MQRKQADLASDVQDILVWVISLHGDLVRNIVDSDNSIEQHQRDGDQEKQSNVVEKHISSFAAGDSSTCYTLWVLGFRWIIYDLR